MKIELNKNKVFFNNGSLKKEIHPFWLRERVSGEKFLDKGTQQRLFDPTFLDNEILINKVNITDKFLEIDFSIKNFKLSSAQIWVIIKKLNIKINIFFI